MDTVGQKEEGEKTRKNKKGAGAFVWGRTKIGVNYVFDQRKDQTHIKFRCGPKLARLFCGACKMRFLLIDIESPCYHCYNCYNQNQCYDSRCVYLN